MAVDPRWRENQRVAEAAAGSANELIPALADIVRTGHWAEFAHPMRGVLRFDTFGDYCREFLGLAPEAVESLLDRSEFKADARTVRKLIREGVQPIASAGRPSGNVRNTNIRRHDDAQFVVARLKRDDPDLAAQVIEGTISPHKAAIQAGIRKPRASIRTDNPAAAVRGLLKFFTAEQLLEAITAAKGTP